MADKDKITITLVRSLNKRKQSHKDCARGLGLKRMHQTISVDDTPCNRGMVNKIDYMLKVER